MNIYICSVCKCEVVFYNMDFYNFCPYCGKPMEVVTNVDKKEPDFLDSTIIYKKEFTITNENNNER